MREGVSIITMVILARRLLLAFIGWRVLSGSWSRRRGWRSYRRTGWSRISRHPLSIHRK
ncbi:hypothetical protein BDV98DRAFT_571816 [Pterulicium gracile]|uniref:Uncharacterized protein n=1 Tax=Pterulicium gracile TaxID=1884261 RepID=A0A5C3QBR3_9AGAR|nr:hypothetical protein BDV98DRAFT_571816 [Pterula gracilis]